MSYLLIFNNHRNKTKMKKYIKHFWAYQIHISSSPLNTTLTLIFLQKNTFIYLFKTRKTPPLFNQFQHTKTSKVLCI